MIKIEALLNGCKATIVRHGHSMPVYLGMLMTLEELETLKLLSGSITYSVEEVDVITKHHEPEPVNQPKTVVESTKKIVIPDKLKKLKKQNG